MTLVEISQLFSVCVNIMCSAVCYRIANTTTPQWNRKGAWFGVAFNIAALMLVVIAVV